MPIFDNFPYTNVHDLNTDWLVKTVKEVKDKTDNIDDAVLNAQNYAELAEQYAEDAETAATNISNIFVTPEMFGAVGDNSTDDTVPIQNAINEAITKNAELNFLHSAYKVTDTLYISSRLNINGNNCFINATLDNKPVIHIETVNEIRNMCIRKIGVRNYGTGNAIEIDGLNSFITCLLSELSLYAFSGWCLKVNEKFSHCKIQLCTFSGNGLYAECGDANLFEKNLFFGQNTTGIYLNTPSYGELNNAIINNTIVNAGYSILIDSGDQTLISNNQMEYQGASDSTNNPAAMVYLRGATRVVQHCIITDNNFGGGTHLNYDLYIGCGADNIITKNRFVAVNINEIYVANAYTGSYDNVYKNDNIVISTPSNPRTDTLQPVSIGAATPRVIIGCWHSIAIDNSTKKMLIRKHETGLVEMIPADGQIAHDSGPDHTLICTLPQAYRPTQIIYMPVIYSVGGSNPTSAMLKVHYNGEVSFATAQTYVSITMRMPSFIVPKFSI